MASPVFVGHDIYRQAAYGANHPLAIPRVETATDLCAAIGWLPPEEYCASPRASDDQLARFHTRDYIEVLRQGRLAGPEARRRHGLGTLENPLFPGLFERASTSVGGSIRAAELALQGRLAFHPAGGTHHGRPDRASGFCYFNDQVFAILTLLEGGVGRLLYVDLDAHHGDGVQDAYANDPRVHTVSIHEQGRWPHTGAAHDVGGGLSRNLPVPRGLNDSELFFLLDEVVHPLIHKIRPEAVVLTCGADALEGDPLSAMALSNGALWSVVERLAQIAPATVVLGGGGYNPWTVARYWAGLWARLSERTIPESLSREARAVLQPLSCDLIDEEEVREAWRTTLADAPNPGPVRKEIHELV